MAIKLGGILQKSPKISLEQKKIVLNLITLNSGPLLFFIFTQTATLAVYIKSDNKNLQTKEHFKLN